MGMETAATMGIVSLVGSGISAYGKYQQGIEQKQAYDVNAEISREKAAATTQAEKLNEFKKRKQIATATALQTSAYVSAGVVPSTGSPIDVLTDSLSNAYLELKIDALNSAVAYRGLMSEAAMEEEAGSAAYEKGIMGATTDLLKGGVDAYSKFGVKSNIDSEESSGGE